MSWKDDIDSLTKEHIETKGRITCEISVSKEQLPEVLDYVNFVRPYKGYVWKVFDCTTCKEHDINFPYHVEIFHESEISDNNFL